MKTNYRRIIITNNPSSEKAYRDICNVNYMKDATPYEVYTAAREQIENGGRLIRPVIKDKTMHYSTVGIFFIEGETEPTPWNMREIEAACRATKGISNRDTRLFGKLADLWGNGPDGKTWHKEEQKAGFEESPSQA